MLTHILPPQTSPPRVPKSSVRSTSAVIDWEAYRKQRRDYLECEDAYLKAYATYYNGPSGHQIKDS
jgi:hypothetical protein